MSNINAPYLYIKSDSFTNNQTGESGQVHVVVDLIQELRPLPDDHLKEILELAYQCIKSKENSDLALFYQALCCLQWECKKVDHHLSYVSAASGYKLDFRAEFTFLNWLKLVKWVRNERPHIIEDLKLDHFQEEE